MTSINLNENIEQTKDSFGGLLTPAAAGYAVLKYGNIFKLRRILTWSVLVTNHFALASLELASLKESYLPHARAYPAPTPTLHPVFRQAPQYSAVPATVVYHLSYFLAHIFAETQPNNLKSNKFFIKICPKLYFYDTR